MIHLGKHIDCAAQPCLGGYLLTVKVTCGCFHGCVDIPMLLLHGSNCAASLWCLHLVLGCASLSKFVSGVPLNHVLGQFLIMRLPWLLDAMGCCTIKKTSCHVTPPPPMNQLGQYLNRLQIWWDKKKYLWDCTLLLESHIKPMSWWNSSCHLTKIDESALGATWGMRTSRGNAVNLVWLIPKGSHE